MVEGVVQVLQHMSWKQKPCTTANNDDDDDNDDDDIMMMMMGGLVQGLQHMPWT